MAETWDWDLLACPATITEGPVWDGGGLLYTSIEDDEIRRFDPATGTIATVYRQTNHASYTAAFTQLAPDHPGRAYYERNGPCT